MAKRSNFKRIVLGLHPHTPPTQGMRLGMELARLLELDLLGLFVKEEHLLDLVALPFIREFNLFGGGWHPLDLDRLSHDLEIAARSAEKAFREVSKTVSNKCRFEVIQGSMVNAIASVSRAGDIVLLFADTNAHDESRTLIPILDAAFQFSSAVMLVPARIAWQSGAIVAIAAQPDDRSIEAATAIAMAAKEDLAVIESSAYELHLAGGIRSIRVSDPRSRSTDAWPGSVLRQMHERLVVMTRADDHLPLRIMSMRHVPVLILGRGGEMIEESGTAQTRAG